MPQTNRTNTLLRIFWLLAGFFLLVQGASAETLVGKVVRVADGDTFTVLVNKTQIFF
jgi:endonuclease YncB( thermonuclease family)